MNSIQNSSTKNIALSGAVLIVCLLGTISPMLAQGGPWTSKADMPTARTLLSTCVIDGRIYAVGGALDQNTCCSSVEEYDPSTNRWTTKANLPETICSLSTCVIDGKLYVIGGTRSSPLGAVISSVYLYDPATDSWTKKADMLTSRGYLSASVVNGKIYAIGGASGGLSQSLKTVEEYDPATDTWTKKTDMPTSRCIHCASVVNGEIYVIGGTLGMASSLAGVSVVEAYNPATDTWTEKADMRTARCAVSTSVVDGKIYSFGGRSGGVYFATVEEYNPSTDTWTTKTSLPAATWGLSTSVVGGKIYAVGGATGIPAPIVSTLLEYDPASDLTGVEERSSATAVPSGYALSQNYPNPFNPTTTIEFFMPKDGYVSLKVFNLLGEEVATLASQNLAVGSYRVDWNARGVASGVYLYRLVAGSFVDTKKMLLLR
jgi:N-acetylneuraminic acid mutarotase